MVTEQVADDAAPTPVSGKPLVDGVAISPLRARRDCSETTPRSASCFRKSRPKMDVRIGEAARPVDFAEELAAAVQVFGVGQVVFGVGGALAAAEHAVGARRAPGGRRAQRRAPPDGGAAAASSA